MPTYQYTCDDCQEVFSRVESILEHGREQVRCPACNAERVTQTLVPFFAMTGKKS